MNLPASIKFSPNSSGSPRQPQMFEPKAMDRSVTRRAFVQQLSLAGAALAALPAARSSVLAAEPESPLVVALVGCAHIHTPSYVKILQSATNVTVKYVWDPDAQRAEKRATELKARAVSDDAVVWSDPEVKAVVICTETNLHHRVVLACAKARKHLFVEKPLGMTGAECREMAEAIAQAGVLFTTGYFFRTEPAHQFIKEQITAGAFGKITRLRASVAHDGALKGIFDTEMRWMADPKIAGCGGFGDLGTHGLDLLMWLNGDVDQVTADIKVVTGRYGTCDESGEALIRFANGATGTLGAGWVDVANPTTLEVSGTEANAAVIQGQLYFKCAKVPDADGKKPWTTLPPASPRPLVQLLEAIGGKSGVPLVTAREAADRVSVMEAMYRAAAEHKWLAPL